MARLSVDQISDSMTALLDQVLHRLYSSCIKVYAHMVYIRQIVCTHTDHRHRPTTGVLLHKAQRPDALEADNPVHAPPAMSGWLALVTHLPNQHLVSRPPQGGFHQMHHLRVERSIQMIHPQSYCTGAPCNQRARRQVGLITQFFRCAQHTLPRLLRNQAFSSTAEHSRHRGR